MADYLEVWKTGEVTVGLKTAGTQVILERTRGHKQRKKSVIIERDRFLSLVEAVLHALRTQPAGQLQAPLPIGMVDGGCGILSVGWEPYYFGRCHALVIRGGVGHCLAVEQKDTREFALWMIRLIVVLSWSSEQSTAE